MKKLKVTSSFFIGLFLLFHSSQSSAQEEEQYRGNPSPQRFWDRVYIGGNIGLQLGTLTLIDISPLIGYKITEKLSAGVGATYLYLKDNIIDFSTNVYGGRVFGRYFITGNFFTHAEYEVLNLEQFDQLKDRINVESILAGIGYNQPIGKNAGFYILGLWNFSQSKYSPYENPIIRAGFNVGL